ncbi:hypothetical protein AGMMS49949_08880 [Alphaproteobacteria bacterium]|nr:hypothetical protein AGMMS49949_08880 [Alphaproteobacteria bacterium]GHS99887.1 hypothetical protein AGMMS50296_8140 [Alphaproteobacteria bacterium]
MGLVIAKEKIELLFKRQNELQDQVLGTPPQEKACKASFITKKQVTYYDLYLNSITPKTAVEENPTVPVTTETGYIFQGRKAATKLGETLPSDILAWLAARDSLFQKFHIPAAFEAFIPQQGDLVGEITKRS